MRLATAPDCFVVDVSEVHDALDRIPTGFKVALQQIFENISPEIPDVGTAVYGRATGIQLDGATRSIERVEFFDLARVGVKEAYWHIIPAQYSQPPMRPFLLRVQGHPFLRWLLL